MWGFGGGEYDQWGEPSLRQMRAGFAEKSAAAIRREDKAKDTFDTSRGEIEAEADAAGAAKTIKLLDPSCHLTDACWKTFKKHVLDNRGWTHVKRRVATDQEKRAHGEKRKGKCYFVDITYDPRKKNKLAATTKQPVATMITSFLSPAPAENKRKAEPTYTSKSTSKKTKQAISAAKQTVAKQTVPMSFIDKLLECNAELIIAQVNPKRGKSAVLYEQYKAASTAPEVLSLGGRKADLKHDLQKGFMTLADADLVQEMNTLLGCAACSVTSGKNTIAAKAKVNASDEWMVVEERYPTSYGCNRGRSRDRIQMMLETNRTRVGTAHATKEKAEAAAIKQRSRNEHFDDWAEEFYNDALPPFDSAEGENYDNDEEIRISVVTKVALSKLEASERREIEQARSGEMKAHEKAIAKKKKEVKQRGKPHYSWPPNPQVDLPAELELVVAEDGKLRRYDSTKKKPMGTAAGGSSAADSSVPLEPEEVALSDRELAKVRSLMVRAEAGGEKFGSKYSAAPQGEGFQDALVQLLKKCTSLEELHWHRAMAGEELLKRILSDTSLGETLTTLALPLAARGGLSPEAVSALAGFRSLVELDLRESLDMEYGSAMPAAYRDPWDSDPGEEELEPMPYTEPLLLATAAMDQLKSLDLDGILNYNCFKYCLDGHVISEIQAQGTKVNLGSQERF
jgi:hypothetical protein